MFDLYFVETRFIASLILFISGFCLLVSGTNTRDGVENARADEMRGSIMLAQRNRPPCVVHAISGVVKWPERSLYAKQKPRSSGLRHMRFDI